MCGGFEYFSHPRGLFGSGNGDYALSHRYQLWTCTHDIRDCEPESARRLTLETRVLDGHSIGGWRVRPLASVPDMDSGIIQEEAGESFQRGGRSVGFSGVVVLVPPNLKLNTPIP
jgi:hypothetical protein